jgi:predicted enzyme related to lactoylglutathione lyase
MSDQEISKVGAITWTDLTVGPAEQIRDFYSAVIGWAPAGLDMGGYDDYVMNDPASGKPVAGVCHARGGNAGLPPVWLIYVNVADIEESIARCIELGGQVVGALRTMGEQGRFCVIRDPAGAVMALFEPAK